MECSKDALQVSDATRRQRLSRAQDHSRDRVCLAPVGVFPFLGGSQDMWFREILCRPCCRPCSPCSCLCRSVPSVPESVPCSCVRAIVCASVPKFVCPCQYCLCQPVRAKVSVPMTVVRAMCPCPTAVRAAIPALVTLLCLFLRLSYWGYCGQRGLLCLVRFSNSRMLSSLNLHSA